MGVFFCFIGTTVFAGAQVVMDSTLGQAGPLAGPNFQIPAKLGKTVGNNLFHSFAEFSLTSDQSATFTGPDSIQNILGRVTGDKASHIDGLLRSEIDGAGLFLMNPNGIVLGKNAKVDVSGSFVLTAQDRIKLGDAAEFTTKSDFSSFSQAAPETFGFLGDNPAGNIEINASKLTLSGRGGVADFVGREVKMGRNAKTTASGYADVRFEAEKVMLDFRAELGVTTTSIDTPSNLTFMASDISMEKAKVTIDVNKKGFSLGGVTMEGPEKGWADRVNLNNKTKITMDNKGLQSGDFEIRSDEIKFDKNTEVMLKSRGPEGPSFKVRAASFELIDSDVECLTTATEGEGGGIDVEAETVLLKGYLRTTSGDNMIYWDVFFDKPSMKMGAKGGDISIKAKDFQIENRGYLRASSNGWLDNGGESGLSTIATSSGDAGNIDVQCRFMKMKGDKFERPGDNSSHRNYHTGTRSSIFSWTKVYPDGGPVTNAGRSGDITIKGDEVLIIDASIVNKSSGSGDVGAIRMDGDRLEVKGVNVRMKGVIDDTALAGPRISNRVWSNVWSANWIYETAETGELILDFDNILFDRSAIVADSIGPSKGGSVEINAGLFEMDKAALKSVVGKTGIGRDVFLNADRIDIKGSSFFSATNGSGQGADIYMSASDSIQLDKAKVYTQRARTSKRDKVGEAGSLYLEAPEITIKNRSRVFTAVMTGARGIGGNVVLNADRIVIEKQSTLLSDIFGQGKGGTIDLNANVALEVDDSLLSTMSRTSTKKTINGIGGLVKLKGDKIILKNGAKLQAGTLSKGSGGEVQISAGDLVVEGANERGRQTGILSETLIASLSNETDEVGAAGRVGINAESILVRDGGYISTASKGLGDAGEISIDAGHLLMENGAIKSEGTHSGAAGSVELRLARGMTLGQASSISVTASQADGGDIRLTTDGRVSLADSELTAAAAGDGGSVRLLGNGNVMLADSRVSAEAGQDGGNIEVRSPDTLVLHRSGLVANAIHGNGGNIAIAAEGYLPSLESVVSASSEFGLEGSVEIDTPETNVGAGLSILPDNLMEGEVSIAERCALRLQGDTSSFFINGTGGLSEFSSENYLPSLFDPEEKE